MSVPCPCSDYHGDLVVSLAWGVEILCLFLDRWMGRGASANGRWGLVFAGRWRTADP